MSNMASSTVNTFWLAVCLSCLCGHVLGEESCVKGTSCKCTGTRVDCSSQNLPAIPLGIPLSTTSL